MTGAISGRFAKRSTLRRCRLLAVHRTLRAGEAGTSLIDVLVGLAVAMFSMVIIYQVFVGIDAVRRNAAAAADAQSSGMFALFALASRLAGAGAGTAAGAQWLDTCPATPDIRTSLRPVDVVITDGGTPDRPDSVVIRQALAPTTGVFAGFARAAPAGTSFPVESPDAFAVGDRVVAISRSGACEASRVTSVSAPVAGVTDVGHTAVTADFPIASVLLNLGPYGKGSTLRYDVVSGTLRSTDVTNGDVPVPLTANVVNLKLQYGIDTDGDGALDTWTSAGSTGTWSPGSLLAAPRSTLERIKAVRAGIIVRSDVADRSLRREFRWVLFDCAAVDKTACPGRLEGVVAASPTGSYRYRAFEAVVPLRNVIWNRSS